MDWMNADKDKERLKRMLSNPKLQKHFAQRFLCVGVIFVIWVYINGGILPRFLRQKIPMLKLGSDTNILTYFPESEEDGVNIKWAHGVNTLDKLERALYSREVHMIEGDVMLRGQGTTAQELVPIMAEFPATDREVHMIEADVMLRGQGTTAQELVPVMAEFPATDSNVTFDAWLDMVIRASSKGFKLDFQAIDALEVTLQKMKARKEEIEVPVWLHANVLEGPLGRAPKVDATRFIRIVRQMFPESTISLGWTTGHHTDLSQSGYSWDMVLDMYHMVHKMELQPPIVYSVRASMVPNSVPQLKWLTDNTRANILLWQDPVDSEVGMHESLMYVCYRFPPSSAFFDLKSKELSAFLRDNRYDSGKKLDPTVLIRDTSMFKPDAWVKMGFYMEAHSILPSTEAVVLTSRAVYMVTKGRYKPSGNMKLQGRVQFLNRKNLREEEGRTGLSIFVRSTNYMNFEKIAGIKCFIGVDGELIVESSHLPGKDFRETQRTTPGSANCFRFSIVDTGKEIIFSVTVQHDCFTLESAKPNDRPPAVMKVPIAHNIGGIDVEHPFIVKLEDSKRTAILDELTVKYIN